MKTKRHLSDRARVFRDCINTFKAWRVWTYMGTQDVRNQFRRSRMGASWIFINLVLMAGGVGYIYGHLFNQDMTQFFPLLILGIVIWGFITATIIQGCTTFVLSEGYVKQFSFPKQVYILRFFITACINLLIGFTVFLGVALYMKVPLGFGTLWFIPGLLLLLFIGVAHILVTAYWGSRFRDLSPALSGLFQILFYVTPIIFTAEMLQQRGLDFIYKYNPLYYLIEIVRYPLLHASIAPASIYCFTFVYCILIWAIALFTMFKYDRKVAYWL